MSLQPINSPTTWKRAQTSINANFTALVNALAGEGTVDATDPVVTALLTDNGSGAYTAVEGIVEDVADAVVEGLVTASSDTRAALDGRYALGTVGKVITPSDAGDASALTSAIASATSFGAPVALRGSFSVNGTISVPTGAHIDGTHATITQTGNLTTLFLVNNADNVTLRNITAVGVGTDYTNTSAVYAAAAVYVSGTSKDTKILGCKFTNFAGAGVRTQAGTDGLLVDGCRFTGPGAAEITAGDAYGAGLSLGGGRWQVTNTEISDYAQGIVTGDGHADVRIQDNYIHDIVGQHGMYLDQLVGGVITGNVVTDCNYLGMKVQIPTSGSDNADDVTITGNVFKNVGDQCVLLTNITASGKKVRRVVVSSNVMTNAAGDGVSIDDAEGVQVIGNVITGVRAGVRVGASTRVMVTDNLIIDTQDQGIVLTNSSDYDLVNNRVWNPAIANGSTTEFGIHLGASTANGRIIGNRVVDANGNMLYGVNFASTADATTHVIRDNYVTGSTGYDYRFATAGAVAEWDNNVGTVINRPTSGLGHGGLQSFGSAAPTTGTHTRGDICWNITATAGGKVGWVCTISGSPGTWKAFGAIDS